MFDAGGGELEGRAREGASFRIWQMKNTCLSSCLKHVLGGENAPRRL